MVRVTILSIFIVSLFAFSSIQCEDEQLSVKMETIDNLTNFLQANPKVRLQPLYRNQLSRGQIRYTLGNRLTGDRLVSNDSARQQWPTLQNVKLTLAYPKTGAGAVVSYVDVLVDQSSNVGQGYVVSGGIGQRQITLAIEANSTLYFGYNSQIYGY